MALGAAWWKPALHSCPHRQQSCSREGAKNAFQGRISVSALTQHPLNSLDSSPYELLHSGQPLWLLLLRLVPECLGTPGYPCGLQPHQSSQLCWQEDQITYRKGMVLQHSLSKAHQPSGVTWRHKQPSGVSTSPQQLSTGHTADYLLTFWCPRGFFYNLHQANPGILIWPVLGSPLGSLTSPTPSLSRLVIHGISLVLILHSPVGFSSHMVWQMV